MFGAKDISPLQVDFYNKFRTVSLKGDREGIWSMTVSGNWRITFEFIDGDAYVLNYEDYH